MQVSKQQITEWLESPITERIVEALQDDLKHTESAYGIDVYHPYEPQKTQEVLANLNGEADALARMIEAFTDEDELVLLIERDHGQDRD